MALYAVDSTCKLLLHCEGADNSTTFVDSSPSHRTVTVYGSAKIKTAQYKYGAASGLLAAGTTDYLSLADSADWAFGSGDYAISLHARFTSLDPTNAVRQNFLSQSTDASNHTNFCVRGNGTNYNVYYSVTVGGSNIATGLGTNVSLSTNTWYHFEVDRVNGAYFVYLDGVLVSYAYANTTAYPDLTGALLIGGPYTGQSNYLNAYIDEVIVIKGGYLNYGGIDAYTVLDLHGDGTEGSTTITDSSSSNKTATVQGNTQISTTSPKYGTGAILFDGNGDYITFPDSADWYMSTGVFTLEFFVKFNTVPSSGGSMFLMTQYVDDNNRWMLYYIESSGSRYWTLRCVSSSSEVFTSGTLWSFTHTTGVWYHMAFVRVAASGAIRCYKDGAQLGTDLSTTGSVPDLAAAFGIGWRGTTTNYFDGRIDEYRVSKGVARSTTTTFPVPTRQYEAHGGVPTLAFAYEDSILATTNLTGDVSGGNVFYDSVVGTFNQTATISAGHQSSASLTFGTTFNATLDGMKIIIAHANEEIPRFSSTGKTGVNARGEKEFALFNGTGLSGATGSKEIPKFVGSGYVFNQPGGAGSHRIPKFKVYGHGLTGYITVPSLDPVPIPPFHNTGSGQIVLVGDADAQMPLFVAAGEGHQTGRFDLYILRYSRDN